MENQAVLRNFIHALQYHNELEILPRETEPYAPTHDSGIYDVDTPNAFPNNHYSCAHPNTCGGKYIGREEFDIAYTLTGTAVAGEDYLEPANYYQRFSNKPKMGLVRDLNSNGLTILRRDHRKPIRTIVFNFYLITNNAVSSLHDTHEEKYPEPPLENREHYPCLYYAEKPACPGFNDLEEFHPQIHCERKYKANNDIYLVPPTNTNWAGVEDEDRVELITRLSDKTNIIKLASSNRGPVITSTPPLTHQIAQIESQS